MKKILLLALSLIAFLSFGFAADEQICTLEHMPVCGQPPMPVCAPGMACIEMMPAPITYGNDCMRRAADATLLYTGSCEDLILTQATACTREYMPVCGAKQVQCITAPCDPIQQTYSNSCMMKNDGADLLYTGTCVDVDLQLCRSYFDGCNTCTVEDGKLGACTLMYCEEQQAPRCLQFVSEVHFGNEILLSSSTLEMIKSILTRILSPFISPLVKSEVYTRLLDAVDTKISIIKNEMIVAHYTPEGYKHVMMKLYTFQYIQFLLRNLQTSI